MEFKYDEESVKEIMEWAQTANLPKEVVLSKSERIFDISAISSNIIRMPFTTRQSTGCID